MLINSKFYHQQPTILYTVLYEILAVWGCMPELTKECMDMTNASSTYVSIALGAITGAVISWWIYNMQKKTSVKQDETLKRINDVEQSHDRLLKSIEQFQRHQEKLLGEILNLDRKIDSIIETDRPTR